MIAKTTCKLLRPTCASLLLAMLLPSASAITLPVLEDSSSTPAPSAAKSAGKATTLQVLGTNKVALMRFGVGAMSSDISAARVSGAWLTFYVSAATKKSDLTLHKVTDGWSESGLSGTNSPAYSSTALFTLASNNVVAKQFVVINVTETVKEWLSSPGTDFGFAVAGSGVARIFLGAKEGAALGYPATLEIQELPLSVSVGGNVGIGTNTPNADAVLQVNGKVRMGSEAGTSQAPNRSILVRRINSTSAETNQVVARVADGVTLERDGTAGGFVIRITGGIADPVFFGTGITATGDTVNVFQAIAGGAVGVHQIFTSAQGIGHFRLSFGRPDYAEDMTEVVLTRFLDTFGNVGVDWVGTVTSTVNQ